MYQTKVGALKVTSRSAEDALLLLHYGLGRREERSKRMERGFIEKVSGSHGEWILQWN